MLILKDNFVADDILRLSPISVREDYLREWNERLNDFVVLTRNGQLVNNNLYRVGGLGTNKIHDKPYFMLLKYVESYYDLDFLKNIKSDSSPKHLKGVWCILDQNGIEKKVFDPFKSPYLVDYSRIYSINQTYYDCETNYCYGESFTMIKSKDYIFLDIAYDKDESKRGVYKVDKKTGKYEIFK